MVLVGNYSDSESLDKRLPDFLELSDTTKVDREARMRNLCERLILKVSQCLRGRVQFASGGLWRGCRSACPDQHQTQSLTARTMLCCGYDKRMKVFERLLLFLISSVSADQESR